VQIHQQPHEYMECAFFFVLSASLSRSCLDGAVAAVKTVVIN
jgi:hypothetical protein